MNTLKVIFFAIPLHEDKQGGNRGIAPLILNLGAGWWLKRTCIRMYYVPI
jgi:hypothetical protein